MAASVIVRHFGLLAPTVERWSSPSFQREMKDRGMDPFPPAAFARIRTDLGNPVVDEARARFFWWLLPKCGGHLVSRAAELGAGLGLFSLFVGALCPDVAVWAIDRSPIRCLLEGSVPSNIVNRGGHSFEKILATRDLPGSFHRVYVVMSDPPNGALPPHEAAAELVALGGEVHLIHLEKQAADAAAAFKRRGFETHATAIPNILLAGLSSFSDCRHSVELPNVAALEGIPFHDDPADEPEPEPLVWVLARRPG